MDITKLLNTIKNSRYSVIAIRHCCLYYFSKDTAYSSVHDV